MPKNKENKNKTAADNAGNRQVSEQDRQSKASRKGSSKAKKQKLGEKNLTKPAEHEPKEGISTLDTPMEGDPRELHKVQPAPVAPKNSLGGEEDTPVMEQDFETKGSKIEVNDPMDIRPKALPLVVKVPASASSAQKEYAKVLNSYAYQNPIKWKQKKEVLIKRLHSLAGKEVMLDDDHKLSVNKSRISFAFIKDPTTKEEYYAGTSEATLTEK